MNFRQWDNGQGSETVYIYIYKLNRIHIAEHRLDKPLHISFMPKFYLMPAAKFVA